MNHRNIFYAGDADLPKQMAPGAGGCQEQEDAIEAPILAADPLPVQEGGTSPNKNKEP